VCVCVCVCVVLSTKRASSCEAIIVTYITSCIYNYNEVAAWCSARKVADRGSRMNHVAHTQREQHLSYANEDTGIF
jgi:hypothetical protein